MNEEFRLRTVTVVDVVPIFRLVNHYANLSLMLPKSQNQIYQNLRDFRVVVDRDDQIVACGALHILWADLAEVRSVAVVEEHQGSIEISNAPDGGARIDIRLPLVKEEEAKHGNHSGR